MAVHQTSPAPGMAGSVAAQPTEPQARTPSRAMRRARSIGWNALPPLTFVAIVALWSLSVTFFAIPAYLLPRPGAVFGRILSDAPML